MKIPQIISFITLISLFGCTGNPENLATDGFADQQSEGFEKWVGLKHPPLPSGLTSGLGVLVIGTDYALNLVEDGEIEILWLSQDVGQNSEGGTLWEVRDVIMLEIEDEQVFIPNGCMQGEVLNYELLAISEWDEDMESTRFITNEFILKVWRIDLDLGKFIEISTDDIECYADNAVRNP